MRFLIWVAWVWVALSSTYAGFTLLGGYVWIRQGIWASQALLVLVVAVGGLLRKRRSQGSGLSLLAVVVFLLVSVVLHWVFFRTGLAFYHPPQTVSEFLFAQP